MHIFVMRTLVMAAAALVAVSARPSLPAAQEGMTVTFLANEGVLLTSGNRKVLIDALFQEYRPMYALPADSTRRALQAARPSFDGVDSFSPRITTGTTTIPSRLRPTCALTRVRCCSLRSR